MDYNGNNLVVKDALNIYFSQYHFKDGGYNLKFFKIKLGKIFIPVPNIPARVRAVKIHDIHHLLTGYKANYQGEAEIGGWEIASGCGKYYVAWILNFGSFLIGMLFYPRQLLHAFLRGRKCKTNLYRETDYNETLLNKTIGELKNEIEIDTPRKNSIFDYLIFIFCCLLTLLPFLILIYCVSQIFKF
jgi:hypothetical protein